MSRVRSSLLARPEVEDLADVELLKSFVSGNMAAKEAKSAQPASHDYKGFSNLEEILVVKSLVWSPDVPSAGHKTQVTENDLKRDVLR
ncbi:hypothetical protein Tco_0109339 [Tanacetum coccineum]